MTSLESCGESIPPCQSPDQPSEQTSIPREAISRFRSDATVRPISKARIPSANASGLSTRRDSPHKPPAPSRDSRQTIPDFLKAELETPVVGEEFTHDPYLGAWRDNQEANKKFPGSAALLDPTGRYRPEYTSPESGRPDVIPDSTSVGLSSAKEPLAKHFKHDWRPPQETYPGESVNHDWDIPPMKEKPVEHVIDNSDTTLEEGERYPGESVNHSWLPKGPPPVLRL